MSTTSTTAITPPGSPGSPAASTGAAPAARVGLVQILALAGVPLALVGFFLPWVQYEQAGFSGFSLAAAIAPALDAVKSGGLKGFHIALHAVPVLAVVAGAFLALGLRARTAEDALRLRAWAGAAALAGLAIVLLFIASGLLSGTPGTQFSPGLVRTDAAVTANAPKALNAGAFNGLGPGVYLTALGLLLTGVGSLVSARQSAALDSMAAVEVREGRLGTRAAGSAWRTQDYVLVAVLAVAFGALYWWWLQPYLWIFPIWAQAGQELFFGIWFVGGLLGGYIIRRPGAAFLAESMAALAEVLLGAPAGPILVVTGIMQALGPELVFAATGYRRWGWATMVLAGVAAALVALPWNWFRLGYFALEPGLLVMLLLVRVISGAAAGAVAKALGDALAATGGLSYFPIGRERVREV